MSYKHGVSTGEISTAVTPPVTSTAGLPIVFGTAPINMVADPKINTPVLCYSYAEAVKNFGFSDDFENYTLCEFIKSQFQLFGVAPVVLINVLDPATHKTAKPETSATLIAGKYTITEIGVLLETLTVKAADGLTTYVKGTDYSAEFDKDGKVVISRIEDGAIVADTSSIKIAFSHLNPSAVTKDEIIGGIDPTTGAITGLELVKEIFPRFGLNAGIILAPKFSMNSEVAAVMDAKCNQINGVFEAISIADIPTATVKKYSDINQYKNENNLSSEKQIVCWPMLKLGSSKYHMSTQLAGVINKVDSLNEGVPYVSPSNNNFVADGAVLEDGTEVFLGKDTAEYLNGIGVVTALNFIGGWKAWGNRTSVYPAVTDPKDSFIPLRRMFNWIRNTIVLSMWQKVDKPGNRRLIESVVDSLNIWFNGLKASGYILGGRVEFLREENPDTALMDGIYKFHVYVTPPTPARELNFIVEYDIKYIAGLFE